MHLCCVRKLSYFVKEFPKGKKSRIRKLMSMFAKVKILLHHFKSLYLNCFQVYVELRDVTMLSDVSLYLFLIIYLFISTKGLFIISSLNSLSLWHRLSKSLPYFFMPLNHNVIINHLILDNK